MAIAISQQLAVTADCRRQESGNVKIGGGGGEDGLMATMIVAAPDDGIRSPSSLASAAAAAAVPTTAIPNGERRDSKSSRGDGTARAAGDGDDLPGASAAVSGSGDDDGR
jgi:hypothetical protein